MASAINSRILSGAMRADPELAECVTFVSEIPPREAAFADVRAPVHPALRANLERLGMERLYLHQARAFDESMAGRDVVVTTGTNSGKTLCYTLPALQMCLAEPAARALLLFPTKALAQDQLGKLEALAPAGLRMGTYDGDTPQSRRGPLRRLGQIVLTNPDMLHVGILPGHEHWSAFLKSLRLIVLDEMHAYRGVFGSNVGGVIRRLLRLCEWRRNSPQIIASSATIGNPIELFRSLTGRDPVLIDEDGSPSGRRTFVFWNPPMVEPDRRTSANVAAAEILATLAESGARTLVFSRARVSAELVLRYARERLRRGALVPPESVESYRAGYTIPERRQIERALFGGELLGLSATNAMELGVDVGGLDAVVLNGYPGSASSFWQQSGRAGRGARDGLAVFVAHDDPLEQFLVRRPSILLEARNESVSANPENPHILGRQLLCAAHERPIAPTDLARFGERALDVAEDLDRGGALQFRAGFFFYPSVEAPAPQINLRGAGGATIRLMLDGRELGSMEYWRALTSAHEAAIYLHRGATFLVLGLDLEQKLALLAPTEADYYTQAIVRSVVDQRVELRADGQKKLIGAGVTDLVDGYRKKSLDGDRVLSVEPLDLPPQSYETVAVRFDLPALDVSGDLNAQLGAVHGAEHALLAVSPLLAGCDRLDLGSAWYAGYPDTMAPAIFAFDKTPGGVGFAEALYERRTRWLRAAWELVDSCSCDSGCPACLLSARCECANENLDKRATLALLARLGD